MKKIFKRIGWVIVSLLLLIGLGLGLFIYKAKYGFPFYDSTPPELPKEMNSFSVLVFNKTNGFPHTEAIEASIPVFEELGKQNGWTIFSTDNGAVFNSEQLSKFDLVIWNNATGRNLKEDQRVVFQEYMNNGGGYLGIHGAGDDSHHWPWYYKTLIGAQFSHHPIDKQIQEGNLSLVCETSSGLLCSKLSKETKHSDEWYVFYDNPRDNGFTPLYTLDESGLSMNGNLGFLVKDKNFGMGKDHPIAWYKCLPNGGRTFYSAMGHNGNAFQSQFTKDLIESSIKWAGGLTGSCP
ncbi:MAG: ThuA domain-containing protein [Maribacter sp.]